MSSAQFEISHTLGALDELTPAGYIVALQINYTTPKFMFQTYNKDWLEHYSKEGLVMSDPTVAWCFENTGHCRWSDLDDPGGVLKSAAKFGLTYGGIHSTEASGSRSMSGFARGDREFDDAEMQEIAKNVDLLHQLTLDKAQLDPETVEQLRNMSIMVTHPGS